MNYSDIMKKAISESKQGNKYSYKSQNALEAAYPEVSRGMHKALLEHSYNKLGNMLLEHEKAVNKDFERIFSDDPWMDKYDAEDAYYRFANYRGILNSYNEMSTALGYSIDENAIAQTDAYLDELDKISYQYLSYARAGWRDVNEAYSRVKDWEDRANSQDYMAEDVYNSYINGNDELVGIDADKSSVDKTIEYITNHKDEFDNADELIADLQTYSDYLAEVKSVIEYRYGLSSDFSNEEEYNSFKEGVEKYSGVSDVDLLKTWYEKDTSINREEAPELFYYITHTMTEDRYKAALNEGNFTEEEKSYMNKWLLGEKFVGAENGYKSVGYDGIRSFDLPRRLAFADYESLDQMMYEYSSDSNSLAMIRNVLLSNPEFIEKERAAIEEWANRETFDSSSDEFIKEFDRVVKRYTPDYYENHFGGKITRDTFRTQEMLEYEVWQFVNFALDMYDDQLNVLATTQTVKNKSDYESIIAEYDDSILKSLDDYEQLEDEEKHIYYYLYKTEGEKRAKNYYDALAKHVLKIREREAETKDAAKFAKEHPFWASVQTIPSNFIGGLVGFFGYLADNADGTVNPYSDYNDLQVITEAMRGQVASDINDKIGDLGGGAYSFGMNIVDQAVAYFVGKGIGKALGAVAGISSQTVANIAKNITMGILVSQAAASAQYDAQMRGLDSSQTFALTFTAAIAEIFFERYGLDAVYNNTNKNWGKALLNSVITNGWEEGATAVANFVGDTLIAGNKSQLVQAINEYMAQGMSEKEAYDRAIRDVAMDVGVEALLGGLSGGIMTSAEYGFNKLDYNRTVKKSGYNDVSMYDVSTDVGKANLKYEVDRVAALVADGSIQADSDLAVRAAEIGEKLNSGKKIKNSEITDLLVALGGSEYTSNTQTTSDEELNSYSSGTRESYARALAKAEMQEASKADIPLARSESDVKYAEHLKKLREQNPEESSTTKRAINDSKFAQYLIEDVKESMTPVSFDQVPGLIAMGDKMKSDGTFKKADKLWDGTGDNVFEAEFDKLKKAYEDNTMSSEQASTLYSLLYEADRITSPAEIQSKKSEDDTDSKTNKNDTSLYDEAFAMAPEGTDPAIFKKAYDSIYFEGRNLNNSTFDSMWEKFNVYEDIIPKDVARIIYQDAVDAKNSERNNAINKAMNPGAKPKGKVSGKMKNKDVDTFVRAVAAKFGADIVITNSFDGNKNASFDPKTGKIYIRSDTEQITKDLVHEMMEAVIAYNTNAAFEIQDAVVSFLEEAKGTEFTEEWIEKYRQAYEEEEGSKTTSEAKGELVNDFVGVLFSTEDGMKEFCDWVLNTDSITDTKKKDIIQSLKKMIDDVVDFFKKFLNFAKDNEVLVAAAQTDYETAKAIRKTVLDAFDKVSQTLEKGGVTEAETVVENVTEGTFGNTEIAVTEKNSIEISDKIVENGNKKNEKTKNVDDKMLEESANAIDIMRDRVKKALDKGLLPPDREGKTFFSNKSYSGTMENTTICMRSLVFEALADMVSEKIGRPLTVGEAVSVSQSLFEITDTPECLYCYVAMDRKGFRNFLNVWHEGMELVHKLQAEGKSYNEILDTYRDGRRSTDVLKKRVRRWMNTPMAESITLKMLSSERTRLEVLQNGTKIQKEMMKDAIKYAQSASWQKKKIDYVAYNGSILKFSPAKIQEFWNNYGLRMYSFSDFSPAFILENMQMFRDAAVMGLPVLAYTKEADFVRIFGDTGACFNMSVFLTRDGNGNILVDGMQGMDEATAKDLRNKYKNAGVVCVVTDDTLLSYALNADWIDTVIPFHMVKTGAEVAGILNYKNYTKFQADKKLSGHTSNDANSILPKDHQNNKEKFLELCEKNHLQPRFAGVMVDDGNGNMIDVVDHPNYMKLVNETRVPMSEIQAVQPDFALDTATDIFDKFVADGGYNNEFSDDVYQDISDELAQKITSNARNSLEVTDRTVTQAMLEKLDENIVESKEQKDALKEYKERNAQILKNNELLKETRAEKRRLEKLYKDDASAKAEIDALNEKIKELAATNNRQYRRLAELESTKAIRDLVRQSTKQAVNEQKQKDAERLNAQKEKYTEKIDTLKQKDAERFANYREGRSKTEIRRKIDRTIGRIDHLLRHGTRERNVKTDLQDVAGEIVSLGHLLFKDVYDNEDIVEAVLMDSNNQLKETTDEEIAAVNRYGEIIKRRRDILKSINDMKREGKTDDAKIESFKAERESMSKELPEIKKTLEAFFERKRKSLANMPAIELIDNLKKTYEGIKKSEYDYIKDAYDPDVISLLDNFKEQLEDTPAIDMNPKQLETVYKAFRAVETTISKANSLFGSQKSQTLSESVADTQSQISRFAKNKVIGNFLVEVFKSGSRKFIWNELDPLSVFQTLGSERFEQLFLDAAKADGTQARIVDDAAKFRRQLQDKYNYGEWNKKRGFEFEFANGEKIYLTLGEMISVYALSKRDGGKGVKHLTIGGVKFVFGNKFKKGKFDVWKTKLTSAKSKVLTTQTIDAIVSAVEKYDNGNVLKYVTEMQKYLSDVMGAKGNEVSQELFGIDLFTEEWYMPMRSQSDFIDSVSQEFGQTQTQVSLRNKGFTKPTKPEASNPLMLDDFDNVWLEHVSEMANYCAYVLPIENLRRVFNAKSVTDGKHVSTKEIISNAFGKEATDVVSKYINDLNGGSKSADIAGPGVKWLSRFKKTRVAASVSVWIQQSFARIRAMDEINPIYFRDINYTSVKNWIDKSYAEMCKYAPIAIKKEIGGYDIGSNRSAVEYMKGADTVGKVIDEVTMYMAGRMDRMAWLNIWEAVKREQATKMGFKYKNKDMNEGFYKACGDRFTEVILKTQVYDSVSARNGYMRSKKDLTKLATSFMGEPTKIVNMLYRSRLQVLRAKGIKAKAKARLHNARTNAVVLVSIILTNAAKALVLGAKDEDEDEAFLEKYLQALSSGVIGDAFLPSSLPFINELVSIYEGYTSKRNDLELAAELIHSVQDLYSATQDISPKTPTEELYNFGLAAFDFLGIPMRNIQKDINAAKNLFNMEYKKLTKSEALDALKEGIVPEKTDSDLIEKAYGKFIKGNSERSQELLDDLEERLSEKLLEDYTNMPDDIFKQELNKDMRSALRDTFRDAYREGDADTQANIREFFEASGLYNDEDGGLDEELLNEDIALLEGEEKSDGPVDWYTTNSKAEIRKFADYIDGNKLDDAASYLDDLITTKAEEIKEEKGYTDEEYKDPRIKADILAKAHSSYKSAFSSQFKQEYLDAFEAEDTNAVNRIKRILLNTGLYGDSDEEIVSQFKTWRKDDLKKQYEEAYVYGTDKERRDIRNILILSGLWASEKKVDEQLQDWLDKNTEKQDKYLN